MRYKNFTPVSTANTSLNESFRWWRKLRRDGKHWKLTASCALGCWMKMYLKSLWQQDDVVEQIAIIWFWNKMENVLTKDNKKTRSFRYQAKYCFSFTYNYVMCKNIVVMKRFSSSFLVVFHRSSLSLQEFMGKQGMSRFLRLFIS